VILSIDDMYQEIILDHYRSPRNKGPCPNCGARVRHDNPLCGDEITLGVDVQQGRIDRITFEGHGCSISQASASMMTEAVQDQTVDLALSLSEQMRQMMHGQHPKDEDQLGDLVALEGVAQFPVRIKCALLPWMALRDALGAGPISGGKS
jgi:nitrogen fixation NifU-like protein